MTERKKYAMHWAPWLKGMGYFAFFLCHCCIETLLVGWRRRLKVSLCIKHWVILQTAQNYLSNPLMFYQGQEIPLQCKPCSWVLADSDRHSTYSAHPSDHWLSQPQVINPHRVQPWVSTLALWLISKLLPGSEK